MGVYPFLKLYKWYQTRNTSIWKLTDTIILDTVLNERICCVNNSPKAINPFLTNQTKILIFYKEKLEKFG